uniref:2'-5'-oligoadenylate synthetase 1 domain-containing protein n=1 Tax=Pelusios castaneus TaxID=367368 RepID=A0A8C8SCF9_9SAUR
MSIVTISYASAFCFASSLNKAAPGVLVSLNAGVFQAINCIPPPPLNPPPRSGGSAGKGTALKNNSDADLVLFLSCFSSYQDQAENRASVLDTIEKQLNRCRETIAYQLDVAISQPKEKGTCPRSLSITIQSKKRRESIEVDVLPAYDALGPVTPGTRPSPRVYEELIQASTSAGEFCTSFTELQRNFVKRRPAKLKNLLRLVKHWYKEKESGLPPKYALELLTIYAWENGTQRAEKFITAEGFHTVMKLLCQYRELCIFWTEFYDLQNPPIIHATHLLHDSLTAGCDSTFLPGWEGTGEPAENWQLCSALPSAMPLWLQSASAKQCQPHVQPGCFWEHSPMGSSQPHGDQWQNPID